MKKIISILILSINISVFAQYPTNHIYIYFDNKQEGLLYDTGGISIQAVDKNTIEASYEKEYEKIKHNMKFNSFGSPIYYVTLKKEKELMQLYFIFYQNDESNKQIVLNNLVFLKGTYYFDFFDNKIIKENDGKEGYFYNSELKYNIKNSVINNHKICNKIINEKQVSYYFKHNKKRPKQIAKILESLTPEYIKELKKQYIIN